MLRTGFFILFLLRVTLCQAQEDSIPKPPFHKYDLKLSYLSSLIYPGLNIGVGYFVSSKDTYPSKMKNDARILTRDRYVSTSLNWYHHKEFHDNFYLTIEWVKRKTKTSGYISELSFGPGVSHTFMVGTTYKVDNYGNVSVVKLAGYSYALLTVGGGWGYDYSIKKNLPYLIFAKMNLICMFPYNSTLYFRPVLELGLRYTPKRPKLSEVKKSNM
jgi:hypothetical protein